MNKREFLRTSGLLGAATFLPIGRAFAEDGRFSGERGVCSLIPSETAGPFPLDLTENTTFFRQDITEGYPGVPHTVRLRIIGLNNCEPMVNVRVNIWHCSNEGRYSGYSVSNNPGQAGLTYLRGYQFTDADGMVEFQTVFPGWYPGRICHIHFQVYVNSSYAAISQLTYPIETKNAIYAANPDLYPSGADPLSYNQDGIFNNGYEFQLATLEANDEGGYDSFLEVAVQGNGIPTGLAELQVAEQFELGQNVPNPYVGSTVVPILLERASDVQLDLYDLQGRKVAGVQQLGLPAGEHRIELDMVKLGLPSANYVYQAEVRNSAGVWRTAKMMTAQR